MRPASRGERRLIAALMAMASVYGWLNFATSFSHPGSIGLDYLAPGTDWMVFYTSIRLALHGAFLTALDGDALTKLMNAQFHAVLSQDMTLRPWISPPGFLVLLVPFAFGGFWLSYFGFEIATAAALAAGLAAALRHRAAWWLAMTCLVSPAAAINVVSGQVAFLSGACLVGGFALLERRPVAAGLVLGLLTFKPQFFILVPVALLARRRWDAMAASAAAALALALGSVAIVGVSPWIVWLHDIGGQGANGIAMAAAKTWGDSVYTIAGLSGLNSGAALAVQAAFALYAAGAVFVSFRPAAGPVRGLTVLLAATMLAAPHCGDYDYLLPCMAGLMWIGCGGRAPAFWCWIIVFCLWIAPLVAPPQVVALARFNPLLVAGFVGVLLYQAHRNDNLSWSGRKQNDAGFGADGSSPPNLAQGRTGLHQAGSR